MEHLRDTLPSAPLRSTARATDVPSSLLFARAGSARALCYSRA